MDMRSLFFTLVLTACHAKPAPPVELGPVAHPMGALKDVRFGMTRDEVKKAAPALEMRDVGSNGGYATSAVEVEPISTVYFTGGRVNLIEVQFLHRDPAELWKAWGGRGLDTGHDHAAFFDAKEHLGADVSVVGHGFAVRFVPFQPLETLLAGSDPQSIAGVEVLGRPASEVLESFKKAGRSVGSSPDYPVVHFAADEFNLIGSVDLSLNVNQEGNVRGWALMGEALEPSPEIRNQVLALYRKRWGTPTTEKGRVTFSKTPWIYADDALMVSSYFEQPAPPGSGTGSAK